MLDAVANAKDKIAKEDIDEESNGDLAKEVFPQVADEEEDDESEQDEETGDKNCNRVEDARKPLSCQTRPAVELRITEFAKKTYFYLAWFPISFTLTLFFVSSFNVCVLAILRTKYFPTIRLSGKNLSKM